MTMVFRKGDVVRCVRDRGCVLNEGEEHTVLEHSSAGVMLEDYKVRGPFMPDRFQLVGRADRCVESVVLYLVVERGVHHGVAVGIWPSQDEAVAHAREAAEASDGYHDYEVLRAETGRLTDLGQFRGDYDYTTSLLRVSKPRPDQWGGR